MKKLIHLVILPLCLITNFASASVTSVVNSNTCASLRGSSAPFILYLRKGENINAAILQCAQNAKWQSAALSGFGAIENPTLHYYDQKLKKDVHKTFSGLFELVSLNGNVVLDKGQYAEHIHVGLGDNNYQMLGGHLDSGTVGILTEITVIPLKGKVIKTVDTQTGFELLSAQ
ncbi:MAG: hypothetical protein K0S08_960 [Gammaproteobacteria bacterium]|jgi:predicted DNA-binding protein with PD1-like motif|nr:hypothetical protein [Gammaproteobacteria bacterium]